MLKAVIQATVDCTLVLAGVFVLVFNAGPMQRSAPVSEIHGSEHDDYTLNLRTASN